MSENKVELEYLEINSRHEWTSVYQNIGKATTKNELSNAEMTMNEAKKLQNRKLNRYRDVNPYDHSRIVLKKGPNDYINANLVKLEKANRQYILTQGPLPDTVGHFWLMVWEQNSHAVLMLNKIKEKNQIKCHWYWPQDIGPENKMILTDVGLTLEYLQHEDYSYYSKRILKLTDLETDTSREILQFHYTTWPDFGVPSSPTAFLEFLKKVRESGTLENNVGPAVIHCSAGIGRSGTFCLVDCCLVLIEKEGQSGINVQNILIEMRRYRTGLIQTPDQLRFSYEAIIEGIRRLNGQDSNYNEYEEVPITSNYPGKGKQENNEEDDADDEDEPPPLPPPRGESLNRAGHNSNGVSSREHSSKFIAENFLMDEKKTINELNANLKDATSDFIISENMQKSVDFTRPLPTIPNSESLDEFTSNLEYNDLYQKKLHDDNLDESSGSDGSDTGNSENNASTSIENDNIPSNNIEFIDMNTTKINSTNIDDVYRNAFKNEICPIGKPLPPIPPNDSIIDTSTDISYANSDKTNGFDNGFSDISMNDLDSLRVLSKNQKEVLNNFSSNKVSKELNVSISSEENSVFQSSPSSPEYDSESTSLRRRARSEKQSALAEKVRDMKRKQQDCERSKDSKRSRERDINKL